VLLSSIGLEPSSTFSVPNATPTATLPTSSSASGIFQWFGVNESGAEFGNTAIPGELGKDYTWPNASAIEILIKKGMNIFRIPILMERIASGTMTSALNDTYLSGLATHVSFITGAGGHAVIDSHNFGRYAGNIITSTSDFQTYWTNVATQFSNNSNVIFDCNNAFHDEPSNALVVSLNQACINGVRAAGATTQHIFVEGTVLHPPSFIPLLLVLTQSQSYTGAWTWTTTSGNSAIMGNLTDPSIKIIYEMHQYLDSDGSGTNAERVDDATAWLKANGKKGILGEFAGGANMVCKSAVTGMLDSLVADNDVWMGAMWYKYT
jgi:endoglucanase